MQHPLLRVYGEEVLPASRSGIGECSGGGGVDACVVAPVDAHGISHGDEAQRIVGVAKGHGASLKLGISPSGVLTV